MCFHSKRHFFMNLINFKLGTFINDNLKMCPETFRHDDIISGHVTFLQSSFISKCNSYTTISPIRLKLCMCTDRDVLYLKMEVTS